MIMKRIYLVAAAALLASAVSFGQNFNPTVEVTNVYQGNAPEVQKPYMKMNVPDSLLRFDLDFDYEVFDKPYQGAYSFKPYMLNMRPEKDAWRGRKLYLKAGAGYTLHPRLEFVFSPEQSGPFQMSVYASHRSYFGDYHGFKPVDAGGFYRLDKTGKGFGGRDALTSAGFDGRCGWDKAILSFGVGYYGVSAKDTVMSRSYNAFDFNARIRSNTASEKYFLYDVGLKGRIANDRPDYTAPVFPDKVAVGGQNESAFVLDGLAGPVFGGGNSLLIGFECETASYTRFYDGNIGRIALIPSYRLKSGRWNLNLGVRFELMFRGDASDTLSFGKMSGGNGQIVYPEAHVSFAAGKSVELYADATGGNRLVTYSSLISECRHMNPSFLVSRDSESMIPLTDNTVEMLNARIGVRGNVNSVFRFDVNGGVGVYGNALMESGLFTADDKLVPVVAYSDVNLLYANALLGIKPGRVAIDADLRFRSVTFSGKERQSLGFGLPAYSGELRARYDISSRLHAGLAVEASSWREGKCASRVTDEILNVRIPEYVDLGLDCGYRFNRKLELWMESGNLLFQTVRRTPFYAEKGPWVTAGLTLSL